MMSSAELPIPLSDVRIKKIPVRLLAKASLLFFSKHILGMQINWHHEEWARLLESKNERLLVQSARGHGKSFFFAKAYPLWLAYRSNKPISICIASFSQDHPLGILIEDREIAETIKTLFRYIDSTLSV